MTCLGGSYALSIPVEMNCDGSNLGCNRLANLGEEWVGLLESSVDREESPLICQLLNSVYPNLNELEATLLEVFDGSREVSRWVKYKIRGFSKLVRLSLECHEKLCMALLHHVERELDDTRVLKGAKSSGLVRQKLSLKVCEN